MITSCIVVPTDPTTETKNVKLSPANQRAYDLLKQAIGHEGKIPPASNHMPANTPCITEQTWRKYCLSGGVSQSDEPDAIRKAFKRAADKLLAMSLIGKWQEHVWVIKKTDNRTSSDN